MTSGRKSEHNPKDGSFPKRGKHTVPSTYRHGYQHGEHGSERPKSPLDKFLETSVGNIIACVLSLIVIFGFFAAILAFLVANG